MQINMNSIFFIDSQNNIQVITTTEVGRIDLFVFNTQFTKKCVPILLTLLYLIN